MVFLHIPETIQSIMTACAVLHNISLQNDEPMPKENSNLESPQSYGRRDNHFKSFAPIAQDARSLYFREKYIEQNFVISTE